MIRTQLYLDDLAEFRAAVRDAFGIAPYMHEEYERARKAERSRWAELERRWHGDLPDEDE